MLLAVVAATFAVSAGAAVIAWLRRSYTAVHIEGSSMEPTYRAGDRVLVRHVPPHRIRRGDVVVIRRTASTGDRVAAARAADSGSWLIKRVAAIPGDPVPREVPALANVAEQSVPAGCLVLLGDAGAGSYDSKHVGYFPLIGVLGVAVRRLPSR